ncbi:MAG: hypothetical protein HC912_06480 [Saprospiraceae bacterium]|nr:hypothetical protein [Saprospiraceae bacterium]
MGGSSAEKVSTNSEFAKVLRNAGQTADKAPLYWGSLPFTSGTYYFGAGMIFYL